MSTESQAEIRHERARRLTSPYANGYRDAMEGQQAASELPEYLEGHGDGVAFRQRATASQGTQREALLIEALKDAHNYLGFLAAKHPTSRDGINRTRDAIDAVLLLPPAKSPPAPAPGRSWIPR